MSTVERSPSPAKSAPSARSLLGWSFLDHVGAALIPPAIVASFFAQRIATTQPTGHG